MPTLLPIVISEVHPTTEDDDDLTIRSQTKLKFFLIYICFSLQHVAPSGGSGGDGGNVIFTVDPSFNTLLGFRGRSNFKAEHGAEGTQYFLIPNNLIVSDITYVDSYHL